MMETPPAPSRRMIVFAVLVAALGYFVDAYDIVIFSAVRVASLKSLGLEGDGLTNIGGMLVNIQLAGMVLGGLAWGIWGDKRGRLEVLFGSILLYSLANLANAYVDSVAQYALCRFFGGIGLAGEVGAGITLVSELMSQRNRGYGTMLVAFVGVCGVAAAGLIGSHVSWKTAYILGGVMGLVLLAMRLSVAESGLFHHLHEQSHIRRGDLRLLFTTRERVARFLNCVFAGAAFYLMNVLFVIFAPEIGRMLQLDRPITSGTALMYGGVGQAVGCLVLGYASQKLQSRKKVLSGSLVGALALGGILLSGLVKSAEVYYAVFAVFAFFGGYWAILLGMVAEQFGTNLRATVATAVPSFVRAFGIFHTAFFLALKDVLSVTHAVGVILLGFTLIALVAVKNLRETYGIDLNYIESEGA